MWIYRIFFTTISGVPLKFDGNYIIIPAAVTYDDNFVPSNFGGYTLEDRVYIKTKYIEDKGLLWHELTHIKQYWNMKIQGKIFWEKYHSDSDFRLKSESEAYKVQIETYKQLGQNVEDKYLLFAEMLCTKYNLIISKDEAEIMLRS